MRLPRQTNLVVLALIALVGQVIIASSHLHSLGGGDRVEAGSALATHNQSHKRHAPLHHDNVDCPFCSLVDSVNNAVVPPPPRVPVPTINTWVLHQPLDLFIFERVSVAQFQARAPPKLVRL